MCFSTKKRSKTKGKWKSPVFHSASCVFFFSAVKCLLNIVFRLTGSSMLRISPSASSACELLNSVSKVNSQMLTKCFRISGASSANLNPPIRMLNLAGKHEESLFSTAQVFKQTSSLNLVQFSAVPQHASCRPGRVRLGLLREACCCTLVMDCLSVWLHSRAAQAACLAI